MAFLAWANRNWWLLIASCTIARCNQNVLKSKPDDEGLGWWQQLFNPFSHLDFTSAAPHIFAGTRDLLQQWPNTFNPNGHVIVPCTIPPFTPLYHGRMDGYAPSSPEWLAFDAEVSYGIMGSTRKSRLLTYQTKREVRCIYFNGMSATLAGKGRLDSQMVLLYGNATGPPDHRSPRERLLVDDLKRAKGLCEWIQKNGLGGSGWGIEGIIRMSAGFEMIWCDMHSPSLKLISYLDVTVPLNRAPPDERENGQESRSASAQTATKSNDVPSATGFPLPTLTQSPAPVYDPADPGQDPDRRFIPREPFQWSEIRQWFTSVTWHYGRSDLGPGQSESRIKSATCNLVHLYSPALASLTDSRTEHERITLNLTQSGRWQLPNNMGRAAALQELSRRRRQHTLEGVNGADAASIRQVTKEALKQFITQKSDPTDSSCSGMDWYLVTKSIAQRYTDSLNELRHILSDWVSALETNASATNHWLEVARDHAHPLLLPFFEYPLHNQRSSHQEELLFESSRSQAALSKCRFSWTRLLAADQGITLNENEQLLKWAVEETLGGICSVILEVGLQIEGEWESHYSPSNATNKNSRDSWKHKVQSWAERTEELIAWLGWTGDHVGCRDLCKWNEKCYIPIWPLYNLGEHGLPPEEAPLQLEEEGLWEPRCVEFTHISPEYS